MAQTSILKSGSMSNRDAFIPNDLRKAGRNFQKRDIVTTVAADAAGSMYGFFQLPVNCVLVSAELSCPAGGTSASIDLGLFQTEQFGGFSATTGWLTVAATNSDQFFGDAIDISGALTKSQKAFANTNFWTVANSTKKLWDMLGIASDPSQTAGGQTDFDVVATCEVAIPNAIAILFEVAYKMV